jgi:hypothetical protein
VHAPGMGGRAQRQGGLLIGLVHDQHQVEALEVARRELARARERS